MNLDINDPSVDPKELFFKFNRYLQEEVHRGLFVNNKFTDFTVFLWIYESLTPSEAHTRAIEHIEALQNDIQLLMAAWIEAGWLDVIHQETPNDPVMFSFTGMTDKI